MELGPGRGQTPTPLREQHLIRDTKKVVPPLTWALLGGRRGRRIADRTEDEGGSRTGVAATAPRTEHIRTHLYEDERTHPARRASELTDNHPTSLLPKRKGSDLRRRHDRLYQYRPRRKTPQRYLFHHNRSRGARRHRQQRGWGHLRRLPFFWGVREYRSGSTGTTSTPPEL